MIYSFWAQNRRFPDSQTEYLVAVNSRTRLKDFWGSDFAYSQTDAHNGELAFTTPWGLTRRVPLTMVPVAVAVSDTTPDPFSLADAANVSVSTVIASNIVTPVGFDAPAAVVVNGVGSPQVRIAGGGWTTGGTISPGQTLQVRATSSASFGNGVVSTVQVGALSVAWTITAEGGACVLPWGGTIANGASVAAYQSSTVPFGSTCASEMRACAGGVLNGSYAQPTCSVLPNLSCTLPWGGTLADGQSVTAYQASTVPFASTCVSEARTCAATLLSGSYTNQSCTVAAAVVCPLPWGGTLPHGDTVPAFQSASVAFGSTCASENRACANGTLSGSYANQACVVNAAANCDLDGQTVTHGASRTFFSATLSSNCAGVSQSRTCSDGTLSGSTSFQYASCAAPAPCLLPWGGTIASGSATTAFQTASVPFDSTCTSESRSCSNGTLSGTFANQSCESYDWTTSAWGSCSAPCDMGFGGGTQTRAVSCRGTTTNALAPIPAWCAGAAPSTSQSCNTHLCTTCLAVGQIFQGGRCVTTGGAGALIAAPSDAPSTLTWGNFGIFRGTTSPSNGAGNTATLAGFGPTAHPAARYCADLVTGGRDDWYLPALDELAAIVGAGLGGFASSTYWTSSEENWPTGNAAWTRTGVVGSQSLWGKLSSLRVRCARRAN